MEGPAPKLARLDGEVRQPNPRAQTPRHERNGGGLFAASGSFPRSAGRDQSRTRDSRFADASSRYGTRAGGLRSSTVLSRRRTRSMRAPLYSSNPNELFESDIIANPQTLYARLRSETPLA